MAVKESFSVRDIAEFKRVARNVWKSASKSIELAAKIEAMQKEKDKYDQEVLLKEAYVINVTGHHVLDLMDRVVTTTPLTNEDGSPKLDEKGRQVITTKTDFVLKYPDTVLPPVEVVEPVVDPSTIEAGTVEEVETSPAEAPFNPIETI